MEEGRVPVKSSVPVHLFLLQLVFEIFFGFFYVFSHCLTYGTQAFIHLDLLAVT